MRYNASLMMAPIVVPRSGHALSRRDIDPDALRVLHRLRQFNHVAYLVGGSVRDLLLGRRPKDFDVGTTAHPYEIKRIFRNCYIIGRRFRLAHVKFGPKTIEVATFRRLVPAGTEAEPPAELPAAAAPAGDRDGPAARSAQPRDQRAPHRHHRDHPHARRDHHPHENTFGTPEEDAFRRDFTINALFYDIATFSIIDYVGGLGDLEAGVIRSIGDPAERFTEDPVRMLRAIALAARLDFRIDASIYEAIARQKREIAHSSPARLLEELYKILRNGRAERTFHELADVGLLEHIAPELCREASHPLWRSLAELDAYRTRFDAPPETLGNPILLGSLLAPLDSLGSRPSGRDRHERARPALGRLPIARRDLERMDQLLGLRRRMLDPSLPFRAQRALMHRPAFRDALAWIEIHGPSSDAVARWRQLAENPAAAPPEGEPGVPHRHRRRRRRRRLRRPPVTPG